MVDWRGADAENLLSAVHVRRVFLRALDNRPIVVKCLESTLSLVCLSRSFFGQSCILFLPQAQTTRVGGSMRGYANRDRHPKLAGDTWPFEI